VKSSERSALLWIAVLIGGAAAVARLYPHVFPLAPQSWTIAREEARAIALERLRDLGDVPADAYVVVRMADDARLEYRLLERLRAGGASALLASELPRRVLAWQVTVYPPGARPRDWTLQADLGLDGRVLSLRRGFSASAPGGTLDDAGAVARAERFLQDQGFDLRRFEAPQVRRKDLEKRTDLYVRFGERGHALGERLRYGLEVDFAGDQLGGFAFFLDDPDEEEITRALQPIGLFSQVSFFSTFLLLPFVAPVFLRRYHLGELGVRRGLQIFGLCMVLGLLFFAQVSAGATQDADWGVLSRQQLTWVWAGQLIVVFVGPLALAAGLSWSAGESFCRERWGRKLAAFDALFQGQWANRTVAVASLRGYAAGFAIAALTLALAWVAERSGAFALFSLQMGPFWNHARFPGLALVLFLVIFGLYSTLFGRLFLLSALVHRIGRWAGGAVAALATAFVFFAPVLLLPLKAGVPIWIVYSAATVVLFLTTDLLTTLIAGLTGAAVLCAFPLAVAESPAVQLQGWLALLAGALPLVLSVRHLAAEREFVYRYEDVPPHVRRIAERERQRVELETARNIQSSILPELPGTMNGIELAHVYLPATEVGGDFYDVLALEDGRLALAVGDVAGHGVASGLVMSMARSALAVQVTFDPGVAAVFTTLNRMVFQSARKRLLATLCYALLDPVRREMTFASAGHLFPYRVGAGGRVEVLESVAYPLGVRPRLDVEPRRVALAAGDLVFLCSDGLVEARPEGSDEHFGFDRLERLLAGLAGRPPRALCQAVLAELRSFAGEAPREDDLTLLALRVP
jgi:hypothetical protein